MTHSSLDQSDISNELKLNLDIQLKLCNELEALADKLPNNVDPQACLSLARTIFPILHEAHQFEEKILFPQLANTPGDNHALLATLERLRFEHWEDESFAEELRECMVKFANERSPDCVQTLSYMLRGFFEGVRRHIAFEREHIIPLLNTPT